MCSLAKVISHLSQSCYILDHWTVVAQAMFSLRFVSRLSISTAQSNSTSIPIYLAWRNVQKAQDVLIGVWPFGTQTDFMIRKKQYKLPILDPRHPVISQLARPVGIPLISPTATNFLAISSPKIS